MGVLKIQNERIFTKYSYVMHLSKSRKEAREKLEAKVKNFEKNYSVSADDLADYEEAKIELEKNLRPYYAWY